MTNQQLISKLQELKQIKPDKQWAFSLKMSLVQADAPKAVKPAFRWSVQSLLGAFVQRKFAYAFAALLFVFVGSLGLWQYGFKTINGNTLVADSIAKTTIEENVKDFKAKSEILAQMLQTNDKSLSPEVKEGRIKEVKEAAKTLATTIEKNPKLAKTIALDVNNNKTVLDIPGGNEGEDLKEAMNTPYKALVEQLIKDQKEASLNKDQQTVLDRVVKLHEEGNDADALVNLLLLIKNIDSQK